MSREITAKETAAPLALGAVIYEYLLGKSFGLNTF